MSVSGAVPAKAPAPRPQTEGVYEEPYETPLSQTKIDHPFFHAITVQKDCWLVVFSCKPMHPAPEAHEAFKKLTDLVLHSQEAKVLVANGGDVFVLPPKVRDREPFSPKEIAEMEDLIRTKWPRATIEEYWTNTRGVTFKVR